MIPIGGTKMVNGDKQKSFRDISAELIVSKELSDLRYIEDGYSSQGFIHLKGAMVVKGVFYNKHGLISIFCVLST